MWLKRGAVAFKEVGTYSHHCMTTLSSK